MTRPKVTDRLLEELGACSAQRTIFRSHFPDGLDIVGEPTEAQLLGLCKLDLWWFFDDPRRAFLALDDAFKCEHSVLLTTRRDKVLAIPPEAPDYQDRKSLILVEWDRAIALMAWRLYRDYPLGG